MLDNEIYTFGMQVEHGEKGWVARSEWQSGTIGKSGYAEGVVGTRCEEPTLKEAIDTVLKFLNRLGIKRTDELDSLKNATRFAISCKDIEYKKEVEEEARIRGWSIL